MPSIPIKTADELARQRRAGALLASVFDMLDKHIQPGITTMEINNLAGRQFSAHWVEVFNRTLQQQPELTRL